MVDHGDSEADGDDVGYDGGDGIHDGICPCGGVVASCVNVRADDSYDGVRAGTRGADRSENRDASSQVINILIACFSYVVFDVLFHHEIRPGVMDRDEGRGLRAIDVLLSVHNFMLETGA